MNRILTLVKYDYLQRVRSYKFLVILCGSLAFASLLIPDPAGAYSTVSIGDFFGNYNSAWIAYVTAIMASVFISLIGYYLINNSIRTDKTTKVGQLVAATGITNFQYLMAKFLGNFSILLTTIVCTLIVAILLFFIHNAGYPFEAQHFLLAYLLIPIPTVIFLSALAVCFEVVFKQRTVLHNVVFFVLFSFVLLQGWTGINGDPFGISFPTLEMERQVNDISTSSGKQRLNIGFVIAHQRLEKRFDFSGPQITGTYFLFRLMWPLLSIFMIYLTSNFFHRFDLNERVRPSKKAQPQQQARNLAELREIDLSLLPALERTKGIWPVFRTEFLMMIRKGNKWLWALNLIGMGLMVVTPLEVAHKFALPILWFLQVHRWADLVTKEKYHQMHFFIYSSFRPVQRLLSAQFMAGISLAVLLAAPLIFRYLVIGEWPEVAAILLGAIFIIALSALMGIATGGKRLFEILFFFLAYLNASEFPYVDYFGGINSSLSYLVLLGGITLATVVLSFSLRRFELRRI